MARVLFAGKENVDTAQDVWSDLNVDCTFTESRALSPTPGVAAKVAGVPAVGQMDSPHVPVRQPVLPSIRTVSDAGILKPSRRPGAASQAHQSWP
jgi:hypothetical protein